MNPAKERAECFRDLLLYLAEVVPAAKPGKLNLRQIAQTERFKKYPIDLIFAVAKEMHTRRLFKVAPPLHKSVSSDALPPKYYHFVSMTEKGLDAATKLKDDTAWHAVLEKASSIAQLALPEFLGALFDFALRFL